MQPPLSVRASEDLHATIELMLRHEVSELPVVDDEGKILGFIDEADITRAYLAAITPPER
jgi:CIC family chloride channel protein